MSTPVTLASLEPAAATVVCPTPPPRGFASSAAGSASGSASGSAGAEGGDAVVAGGSASAAVVGCGGPERREPDETGPTRASRPAPAPALVVRLSAAQTTAVYAAWRPAAVPAATWVGVAAGDLSRIAATPWPDPPAPAAGDGRFLALDGLVQTAARSAAFHHLGRRTRQKNASDKTRVYASDKFGWAAIQARWEGRRAAWVAANLIAPGSPVTRCPLFLHGRRSGECKRWWCPYCRYRLTRLLVWRFLLGAEEARRRRRQVGAALSLVRLEAGMATYPCRTGWGSPHVESELRRPLGDLGWMLRPSTADLRAGWIFGGPAGRFAPVPVGTVRPGRAVRHANNFPSGRSAVPDEVFPGKVVARLSVFQPIRLPMPSLGGSETGPSDRSDWVFAWGVRESVVALCWVYPPGQRPPGRPGRAPRGTTAGPGPLGQPLTPTSHCRLLLSPQGSIVPVGRFAPAVRPYTPRALASAVGAAMRLPGWVGRGPTTEMNEGMPEGLTEGLFPHLAPTKRSAPGWRPVRRIVAGGVVLHRPDAAAFLVDQTPGGGDARWRPRCIADPAAFGRLLCRQAVTLATTALDGPVPAGVELMPSARRRLARVRTLAAALGERLRLAPGRVTGPDNAGTALRRTLQVRRLRAVVLDLVSVLGLPRPSAPVPSSRPQHPSVLSAHPG